MTATRHSPLARQRGQVMLLTVLILSALFVTTTAIAGFLTTAQLARSGRVAESAEAIFAADAAVERGLFSYYRCSVLPGDPPAAWGDATQFIQVCAAAGKSTPSKDGNDSPEFLNGATYELSPSPPTPPTLKATGRSGKSARAFEVTF